MQSHESAPLSLSERLVIAMDLADLDQVKRLVDQLADLGPVFKFGYHGLFSGGLDLAKDLARQGIKIFLDAKLHDIPNSVARAVAAHPARDRERRTGTARRVARNIPAGCVAGPAQNRRDAHRCIARTSVRVSKRGVGRKPKKRITTRHPQHRRTHAQCRVSAAAGRCRRLTRIPSQ